MTLQAAKLLQGLVHCRVFSTLPPSQLQQPKLPQKLPSSPWGAKPPGLRTQRWHRGEPSEAATVLGAQVGPASQMSPHSHRGGPSPRATRTDMVNRTAVTAPNNFNADNPDLGERCPIEPVSQPPSRLVGGHPELLPLTWVPQGSTLCAGFLPGPQRLWKEPQGRSHLSGPPPQPSGVSLPDSL